MSPTCRPDRQMSPDLRRHHKSGDICPQDRAGSRVGWLSLVSGSADHGQSHGTSQPNSIHPPPIGKPSKFSASKRNQTESLFATRSIVIAFVRHDSGGMRYVKRSSYFSHACCISHSLNFFAVPIPPSQIFNFHTATDVPLRLSPLIQRVLR